MNSRFCRPFPLVGSAERWACAQATSEVFKATSIRWKGLDQATKQRYEDLAAHNRVRLPAIEACSARRVIMAVLMNTGYGQEGLLQAGIIKPPAPKVPAIPHLPPRTFGPLERPGMECRENWNSKIMCAEPCKTRRSPGSRALSASNLVKAPSQLYAGSAKLPRRMLAVGYIGQLAPRPQCAETWREGWVGGEGELAFPADHGARLFRHSPARGLGLQESKRPPSGFTLFCVEVRPDAEGSRAVSNYG